MSRGLGATQRRILDHLATTGLPFFLSDLGADRKGQRGEYQSLNQAAHSLAKRGLISTWLNPHKRTWRDSEHRQLVVGPPDWDRQRQGRQPGRCERVTLNRKHPNCGWDQVGICRYVVPCAPPLTEPELLELRRRQQEELQAFYAKLRS